MGSGPIRAAFVRAEGVLSVVGYEVAGCRLRFAFYSIVLVAFEKKIRRWLDGKRGSQKKPVKQKLPWSGQGRE